MFDVGCPKASKMPKWKVKQCGECGGTWREKFQVICIMLNYTVAGQNPSNPVDMEGISRYCILFKRKRQTRIKFQPSHPKWCYRMFLFLFIQQMLESPKSHPNPRHPSKELSSKVHPGRLNIEPENHALVMIWVIFRWTRRFKPSVNVFFHRGQRWCVTSGRKSSWTSGAPGGIFHPWN